MPAPTSETLLRELRMIDALLPGPAFALEALEVTGEQFFTAAFDVNTVAMAAAASAVLAGGDHTIDRDLVVASYTGTVAVDGDPVPKWADLSGYYATRDDRFMQFHANFPHHAAGIVRRLGCEPDRESVAAAVMTWDPVELESALITDGMIAARLRTLEEWSQHPHGQATANLPLLSVERIGDGSPRDPSRQLRVADCSRVLAGPVAGQTLASHGADVVRVGAAHLPSVEVGVISTGAGKRNAFVDLETESGRGDFARFLSGADVWIDAYRPGAFAGRGFTPVRCATGSVIVQLCAFDWEGPWAGRRGFDSIVQSTTGIVEGGRAAAESDRPTPLPVQALDYATGYLAAAAAQRLAAHQADVGGTWLVRLSLLRTRNWLVSLGGPTPFTPAAPVVQPDTLVTMPSAFGAVTVPRPLTGTWPSPPQHLGSSPLTWLASPHHHSPVGA